MITLRKVFTKKRRKIFILTVLNLICILSLGMILSVYGNILYYQARYAVSSVFDDEVKNSKKYYDGLPKDVADGSTILTHPLVSIPIPKDPNFSIIIPKIGINKNVVPNVDINNEAETLDALQHGAGWAKGTVAPGMDGNSLIFAHSTRNAFDIWKLNAEFSLLGKMEVNDVFTVEYQGRQYDFVIFNIQIVDASDRSYITPIAQGKIVTLQTCYPLGSDKQRLLVHGRLIAMQLK